ncbi:Nodule Cysteine-Rich (NCR) secreted peptide [Medicago truncatula]|uniref:Nodule Cysteine-Rich (NCR) secreted peptide n=1 Tax=Medicago truncatula TaxID=3880 RepID=A0A072UY60_MEDTR|nr:Nodule Cysteine-Rich (NCR) secreted peptide [Medicago truncatula]
MVEIVKFTYVMIILISLFLFSTNVDGKPIFISFKFNSSFFLA